MDDQDFLEIDSPLEHEVDADDDEIDEEMLAQNVAGAANSEDSNKLQVNGSINGGPTKSRANVGMDQPIHYPAKPKDRSNLLYYPNSLPYTCESLEQFDARLDDICHHIIAGIKGKDFDAAFMMWNHSLQCLLSLKYPIQLPTLARLARVYYHLALRPGIHPMTATIAASGCMTLLGNRKKISIAHLVLPWRPLYKALKRDLFAKERKTGLSSITDTLLDLVLVVSRFFDPDETEAMLNEMMPMIDGSHIDSIISPVSLMVDFLPTSHPQRWLPTMFRIWESFSSSMLDEQMLELCARLAEQHVEDPRISTEKSRSEVGIFADLKGQDLLDSEEERSARKPAITSEQGLWNDVGIFTEHQFNLIMTKCLRSAGLPVGTSKAANAAMMAQSSSIRTGADTAASQGALKIKKPSRVSQSYATIIVYSMMRDASSPAPTPSGAATPTDGPIIDKIVSNGVNGQMAGGDIAREAHLAGSKALGALARYVQATDSYFHPSNWGPWVSPLSSLVKNLTIEFAKRWKEEAKAECKTPKAYRLTSDIKREFCATLRTVCLLSLFSKDPMTIANTQSSLKRMAMLEPSLILPPVLERAYSSLEALETTQRTMSIITALSTLSLPLVSRHIYKEGGKHLVPLLHLCIPGIDLNDSMKTVATSVFIVVASSTLKIDDLTRPELNAKSIQSAVGDSMEGVQGFQAPADLDEEDEALRLSTAGFEDWTVGFFRRVLTLFEALPEEGKNGRAGGRMEEQVTSTLLAACDSVCGAMSDHLFDINFKIVADYCLGNVTAQAVRVMGSLISCFARHSPKKVLKRLLKPCAQAIREELDQGASSVRTTSTSQPLSSDVALHWHMSILIGALTFSGDSVLEYRQDVLELLSLVCQKTKSERGYAFAAMLVQRILLLLVSVYPIDYRFLNQSEWQAADNTGDSFKHWGKMYGVKDVKVDWHVPSDDEVAFALQILEEIVTPRLDVLERLQQDGLTRDKVWSNDFCRNLTVVRLAYGATNTLIQEEEEGGGQPVPKPFVQGYDEFLRPPERFQCGFVITDVADPRFQKVKTFRNRFGTFLHLAAQKTHDSDAEDQIDCVKLLVRSIRTFMVSYAFNGDDLKAYSRGMTFYYTMSLMHPRQKLYPRAYWIRRAAYHHASRGRLNSLYRTRTALGDQLTADVVQLTMSNYTSIRKTAQNVFETIVAHYDGSRALSVDKFLNVIQNSTDDDPIKGALHVLGSKSFSIIPLRNPLYTEEYFMTLLQAQHHSKPSIQKLLRGIINSLYARLSEPNTISGAIETSELDVAISLLETNLEQSSRLTEMTLTAPSRQRETFNIATDAMWMTFTDKLLKYAQDPSTHWSFAIFAARILRTLLRKDKPIRPDVAAYFTRQLIGENPVMRRVCQNAVTKILIHIKLRTLSKTNLELLIGKSDLANHPLKREEPMPSVTPKWKEEFLTAFSKESDASTKLFDRLDSGWLVWAKKRSFYLMPPKNGKVFEWHDVEALHAMEQVLTTDHWRQILGHLAQEKDRDAVSIETVLFVKSIFQAFGISQLDVVKEQLSTYISERDRHKHRAASEMMTGIVRGAKHWPTNDAKMLWSWLDQVWPKILAESTPDSQPAWEDSVECMLRDRDPRRALDLVNLIVKTAKEAFTSDQNPWEQAKAHNLLRDVILASGPRFSGWSSELTALYKQHFESEYNEVRSVSAANLTDMELFSIEPSYATVDDLLTNLQSKQGQSGSLLTSEALEKSYSSRLSDLNHQLAELKPQRKPKAQGTSRYDLLAFSTLAWIGEMLCDHRRNAMSTSVVELIPTIFEICNLQDNTDLSNRARTILFAVVSTNAYFDQHHVTRLVHKVLDVIKNSGESWRAKLDALPVLQVVFFQNLFHLDAELIAEIVQMLLTLLSDSHLEVRNLASATLGGIIRCSQRELIHDLKKRFTAEVMQYDRLPKRGSPNFSKQLTQLHAGILGATALIGAFPYSVPKWMPALICDTVARQQDAPDPVGPACKKMAAEFKRTHQDTWEEDKLQFDTDQLTEYYEWGGRTDYYA